MSLTASSNDAPEDGCSAAPARAMAITGAGLVLGTTVLAPMCCDASGKPEIAIVGAEERILGLLAVAYGGIITPAVLQNFAGPCSIGAAVRAASLRSSLR